VFLFSQVLSRGYILWKIIFGVIISLIKKTWFWSKELGLGEIMDSHNKSDEEHSMEQEKAGLQKSQKKRNNQTIRSKTRGTTEPIDQVIRQLADQLITVFIVGLLCLWLAALRSEVDVPAERGAWWHFMILSVFALLLWLFWGRKKVHRPRLRWVLLCVLIGFVWLTYLISGISFTTVFFVVLAILLLILAVLLLLALVFIMTRWGAEGKLGKAITKGVRWGDYFYWPLSLVAVMASVWLGWKMLWDTGMRGWWMTPLLYLTVLVFIVVGLVHSLTSHSGGKL